MVVLNQKIREYKCLSKFLFVVLYFLKCFAFFGNYCLARGGLVNCENQLIQTRLAKAVPVILIGKEYWHFFMKWVDEALKNDLVQKEDIQLFVMTNNLDEAFSLVHETCKKRMADL